MELELRGKVALVAALSAGIGRAQGLAAEGAKVSISSRSSDAAQAAASEIAASTGSEVVGFACDLAKGDQIQDVVRRTNARLGPIAILVTNQGGPAQEASIP